KGMFV
ncbi:hypothetical protein AALP_AA3G367300, partial [Arabis alpina]